MATQDFEALRARAQALGYRLYVTKEGTQLVIDHEREPTELVFIHETGADDELEEWIADREQVSERVRRTASRRSVAETNTERALHALERADRLLNVCRTSVEALNTEHSGSVAFTMGTELFEAIDDARKALEP